MDKQYSYLFLLDNLEIGGIQRQLLEVCRYLVNNNNKCKVISFRSEKDEMSRQFIDSGVDIELLNKSRLIDINFIFKLRKSLRKDRYDLIHAMSPQTAFWCSLVKDHYNKTPLISSLLNTYKFNTMLNQFLEKNFVLPCIDSIFVNSLSGIQYYKNMIGDSTKVKCIYNGVKTDYSFSRSEIRKKLGIDDEFCIVSVGRLQPVKGHEFLIKVFAELAPKYSNIKLYIIGGGPLQDSLYNLCQNYNVLDSVIFMGERTDIEEILCAFDLFIMPSKSEGFPNALLEAMAAGLPCIAADVGGIPEIIQSEFNGLLYKSEDNNDLYGKIELLLRNKELKANLASAGKRFVKEHFDMNLMLSNMKEYYEKIIQKRKFDLVFVLSKFPKISETFILREMIEIKNSGLKFKIISLKPPTEKITHSDAKCLVKDTLYLPWVSSYVLKLNLNILLHHPLKYSKVFIHFLSMHLKSIKILMKAFAIWWKTAAFSVILKKYEIKHIHANWATMPASSAVAISFLNDYGFSFTAHAFDIYGETISLQKKLSLSKFVTTCTKRNVDYLNSLSLNKYKYKIHLVRHFLTVPEINIVKNHSTDIKIVSVASLEKYKGHDILIKAVGSLINEGINMKLSIIGDGKEKIPLLKLIDDLNIKDNVILKGWMPQEKVFEELVNSDIFALASRDIISGDNLPNVLVEASLLKIPCVVSNIGSISEFIENNYNGVLVKPDSIQEFKEGIRRLLTDIDLRKKLSLNAYNQALKMFDKKKNMEIIQELLKKEIAN